MKIQILYFDGCPNHPPTFDLVSEAVNELGLSASIEQIEISDLSDAKRFRFLGSPTVLVDGEDIEPGRRTDGHFSMSCRRYGDRGIPPRTMVFEALTRSSRT
jgi:hypothetical protein